jgi:1-acyl-sn-glycerol-3-phosphate acyltransferase
MFDLYRLLGKIWFFLIGIRHTNIYKSSPGADEQFIFVANHISYLDAVTIILSIKHHFRAIGKYELLKVPIFGFLYRFCVVTVNRSSAEDRARSLADLRKILAKNISIAVFPEGTFNMADAPLKEMYDGAFKLAVETGKRIQPILFLDTYDRLHYDSIFSLRPGRSRAVFLDPIDPLAYPEAEPRELKRITAEKMASALITYKATWISDFYLENNNHG